MAKGRQQRLAVVGVALVAVSALIAVQVGRQRQRHRQAVEASSWLPKAGLQRFTTSEAGVFRLDNLERSPNGMLGGAGVLQCSDTKENVPISALVNVSGLVLYSVEVLDGEILLLFMQVPSVAEMMQRPFLDRAVRAVADIGSKVYVVRLDAVENFASLKPLHELSPREQSHYSIVWNTGRCGSTLMHRMLQKVGVLSFSEPYWFERIANLRVQEGFDDATVSKLFGVCGAVDVMLARKALSALPPVNGSATTTGASLVSFNPKVKCFVMMEAVVKAMPHARHMIMYRDVRKVAESFCRIWKQDSSGRGKLWAMLPWAKRPGPPPPRGDRPLPTFSKAMTEVQASGLIVKPSKIWAWIVTRNWMETMCLWQEMLASGMIEEKGTLALRMEDYILKDPEMIESILRFVLGDDLEISQDVLTVALEAFERHSQEGDRMAKSSFAAKVLNSKDLKEIEAVAAVVPLISSCDFGFPYSLRPRSP